MVKCQAIYAKIQRNWTYLVRIQALAGSVCQWWNVERVWHQVFLSIHQVLQLLLIQKTLEKLAVIRAGQFCVVITLRKVMKNTALGFYGTISRMVSITAKYFITVSLPE